MTAKRRKVEEALIRWREQAEGESRINYYFDCGELGIAHLFVCYDFQTRYWQCRWLEVEPCPVYEVAIRRALGREWQRPTGPSVEYEVGDESPP